MGILGIWPSVLGGIKYLHSCLFLLDETPASLGDIVSYTTWRKVVIVRYFEGCPA